MALSRTRIAQLLAVLLATALALLAVPGSPLRPSAAGAAGCDRLVDRSVSIDAKETTTSFWTKMDRSHQTETTKHDVMRGPVNLGRMTLTLELCKAGGAWSIRKVQVSQPHNDLALTVVGGKVTKISPVSGSTGYAIIHRRTTGTAVELAAYRCTPKPKKFTEAARDVIHGVTSLPLPGSYAVSVAAWAVNVAVPASAPKYACGQMGSPVTVKLSIKRGKPRLVWPASGHYLRVVRDTWEQPCGGDAYIYCAESWDQVVSIDKA